MEDLRNEQFEDYVNLSEVYLTLKREIKLFAFIIILISGIGFVRAKQSKPIWKATFQIVLTDKSPKTFSAEGRLQGLLNKVSQVPKDLETQVKILKSPVILLPAFKRFIDKFPEEANNYKYKELVKWYRKPINSPIKKIISDQIPIIKKPGGSQGINPNKLNIVVGSFDDKSCIHPKKG